jgi:hypothetical protein
MKHKVGDRIRVVIEGELTALYCSQMDIETVCEVGTRHSTDAIFHPAEPPTGSAVRCTDGVTWLRTTDAWVPSDEGRYDPDQWSFVLSRHPTVAYLP